MERLNTESENNENGLTHSVEVKPVVIPPEMLDLVRFLANTWHEIDKFVYANCDGEALMKYPVIQGTSNQINLIRIGEQHYDLNKAASAVKWMCESV